MRRLIFGSILFLCVSASAENVDKPSLPVELRGAIEAAIADNVWSSVTIGMIRGDQESRWFFDRKGTVEDLPSVQRGRYELDAISAVYGGVLLAEMANTGVVKLGDRLEHFLPEGMHCADARVCALTLAELASHRSGLPAVPPNFFPQDGVDPFRDYSEAELLAFVQTYHFPDRATVGGGQVLEFGLLGWALAHAHGADYATALRERVLRPLGLNRTDNDDGAVVAGRNLGESDRPPRHFLALAAAGALRSDLGDQLSFLHANLKPGESPLRPALLLARHGGDDAATSSFGLGWQIQSVRSGEQDWPLLWQRGSGGAHASFVGFRSDRQEAVVVFADSTADVARIGLALLRDAPSPPMPATIHPLLAQEIKDYVGLYEVSRGQELIVRTIAGDLSVQSRGQLPLRLYAIDADRFVYADMPAQIVFQRDGRDHVEALRISQAGVNIPARRLSVGVPVLSRAAIVVSAQSLQAAVGVYRVDENTQVQISEGTTGLRLQFTGTEPRQLFAYAEDRYTTVDGELDVTLRRNAEHVPDAIALTLFGEPMVLTRLTAGPPLDAVDATTALRSPGSGVKPGRAVRKPSAAVPAAAKPRINTQKQHQ